MNFSILIVVLLLMIVTVGYILPSERTEQRRSVYDISQKRLFEIVTNNNDFSYRSDLKDLVILNSEKGIETWEEVSKNGQKITFKTIKKVPYSYYEIEIIEANGFKGYWKSEFKIINENKTEFIATEHIIIKNPIKRLLSYIFFDIGEFMDTFQNDLRKKVDNIKVKTVANNIYKN
ncbi:hypothetical protein [Maribacter thermophilus]|uniref:hypothetical protein n=1 Tax=Maribacter thermophilus TaxID=1197874 RepID=UPI000ACD64DD|nr:hypothetical protein [Maribacter thermophilus]